jgi:aspartyl-tRNA(Asn)/glutamyl-tRNA(Gln) amidotransferase subunit A
MQVVSYLVPEPADLPIAEASQLIAGGDLSPLELVESCLERATETEPAIRAFVTLDKEGALAQARSLTEELANGRRRGPLHGIPLGIKDLIDVSGLPTTAASRILRDNMALKDAPVINTLRASGAVIAGKTNTQEFAYGVVTSPTRNPWDLEHIPGGSSGGSAAAVVSGMCPGAIGTDTAGSIRIPAALCGVSGLMPRHGRVPVKGIIPLAPSLDSCGPIARDAADLRLMWSALSGDAPTQPAAPGEVRIAAPESPSDIGEIDPEVEAATEGLIETLVNAGAARVDVELPHLSEWDYPRAVLLMLEALTVHREAGWYPQHAGEYQDETRASFEYAENLPESELESSQATLKGLRDRLFAVFEDADVLVLPTTPVPAPTVAEAGSRDEGHRTPVARTLTRICGPVNVCRLAAASVPCGFTRSGLPVGAQIVGPDEGSVLAAALLYQSLTDWHRRRPPRL